MKANVCDLLLLLKLDFDTLAIKVTDTWKLVLKKLAPQKISLSAGILKSGFKSLKDV